MAIGKTTGTGYIQIATHCINKLKHSTEKRNKSLWNNSLIVTSNRHFYHKVGGENHTRLPPTTPSLSLSGVPRFIIPAHTTCVCVYVCVYVCVFL